MKKAVGYVRVSTTSQAEKGESLKTQQIAIKDFCNKEGIDLLEIYRDEGIPGGTVKGRPALLRLLDEMNGVDSIIVHRLSRLGRSARELLNNVHRLNKAGLQVFFIKENIDQSSPYGEMIFTMMAAFAEMEREITREASHENKINRCRAGIPATGNFPFGRKYDRKTNEWYFDPPDIKEIFQDIVDRYLQGESLKYIASTIPKKYKLGYSNILRVIRNSAGDTWEINFKGLDEPIIYEIPPLLDQETIDKVKDRLKFNRMNTRQDAKEEYVLGGFIRCNECKKVMTGQVQRYKETRYKYYVHPGSRYEKCKALSSIKAVKIQNAVFQAIMENFYDETAFKQAIQNNLPDPQKREKLATEIKEIKKNLSSIARKQDTLLEALINETMSPELIKKKDRELTAQKERLERELQIKESRLEKTPTTDEMQQDGEMIRAWLKEFFSSQEHFNKMTFDQKRNLLDALFNGEDDQGTPYGVYLERISKGVYSYFIYARFFNGTWHLKGDDFDYNPDDNGNGSGQGQEPKTGKSSSISGKFG
jgi:site-specific DNA recombinase